MNQLTKHKAKFGFYLALFSVAMLLQIVLSPIAFANGNFLQGSQWSGVAPVLTYLIIGEKAK